MTWSSSASPNTPPPSLAISCSSNCQNRAIVSNYFEFLDRHLATQPFLAGERFTMPDIVALTTRYREHARFEETDFLPLSQTILGRNANHMAALGMSLHMRHAKPVVGYI